MSNLQQNILTALENADLVYTGDASDEPCLWVNRHTIPWWLALSCRSRNPWPEASPLDLACLGIGIEHDRVDYLEHACDIMDIDGINYPPEARDNPERLELFFQLTPQIRHHVCWRVNKAASQAYIDQFLDQWAYRIQELFDSLDTPHKEDWEWNDPAPWSEMHAWRLSDDR